MDISLLKELLDHVALFERETGKGDLHSFALWLYQKHQMNGRIRPAGTPNGAMREGYDGFLTRAIGLVSNHAKHYFKIALKDTPLVSMMDYFFLKYLEEQGSQRKTDLISKNLAELSPGMEVIRRLLRFELVEDFPDPDDGRSKRVQITEEGSRVFHQAHAQVEQASMVVMGNLHREEKAALIPILRKLIAFHDPIWAADHGASLEMIIEKYLQDADWVGQEG